MKLLFVGDPHLDSQTPISRLDDYREVTLKKLYSLLDVCIELKINKVIMAGDMFDKYDQPITYLLPVIEAFKAFKDNNIEVLSLIGNHDLPHNNMSFFKNTPLNLLFTSGLVKHIDNSLEGTKLDRRTKLYGIDFTNMNIVDDMIVDEDEYNILVMHYATDNTIPYESIERSRLEKFDLVMSGHDHMYYEMDIKKGTTMLRPGSFTRRTKDAYNLTRDIILYMYDTESEEIKGMKLPGVEPAEFVFKQDAFTDSALDLYKNKYNELFSGIKSSNEEIVDIEEILINILKDLPITVTTETKKSIVEYLVSKGYNI